MIEEIIVNNQKYMISDFYGEVVNQQVSSTSYSNSRSGTDAYGNSISSRSSGTVTTKEFFLVNEHGEERAYSFTALPIPSIRPGHIGQVIHVTKEGSKKSVLVLVRNVTLNTDLLREKEIGPLCVDSKTIVLELALVAVAVFCMFFSLWYALSFLFLDGGFSSLALACISALVAIYISTNSNARFTKKQQILKDVILNRRK
jgi:hypothetical protein